MEQAGFSIDELLRAEQAGFSMDGLRKKQAGFPKAKGDLRVCRRPDFLPH